MRLHADDLKEDSKLKINKPKQHNNRTIIWVTIAIMITLIIIFTIMVIIKDIQPIDETIKLYIDGQETKIEASTFFVENNKVYLSVRKISNIVGYEAHSGEYKIEAEDNSKVFVENKQETASMFLNSTIISKIEPEANDDYKNYTMSEPARNINGDIYVISDGIEIACNVKVDYDATKKIITVKTLPYIYDLYNKAVQELGFTGISDEFENQKAILYDRLVIKNSDGRYGVIDSTGTEIIGTRYAHIKFDEYNKEFTITNANDKFGIDYINGETKINVNYDEIKSIHKDKELYLVKNNEKYGIIDKNERIIIHIEYDDIGIDVSPYITKNTRRLESINDKNDNEKSKENTVKQYIFFDSIIAVKQNELWGFFDLSGNKLSDIKYTDIGCKAKEVKEDKNNRYNTKPIAPTKTTTNLLLIDEYELIVVEQNEKFGLVDTSAKELFKAEAEDMYSITDAGIKTYYMLYKGQVYNLENDIFKELGLIKKTET